MPKPLSTILLITILVCALAFVNSTRLGLAQASTPVNGIITSDTPWTKANSPYNLTGNILINNGTPLTVEAGTTLNLNGYYIIVNGSLIIKQGATLDMANASAYILVNGVLSTIGTNANPVRIIGYKALSQGWSYYYSAITFSKDSIGWNQQASSGSIIEDTILDTLSISVSSSVKLTNNTLIGPKLRLSGGSPLVTDNIIGTGGIDIGGGSPIISNNTIYGSIYCSLNGYADGQRTAYITDNVISGVSTGNPAITLSGVSFRTNLMIERNLITANNGPGIDIVMIDNVECAAFINNNTISNNSPGIHLQNGYPQSISYNNVYNNTLNVELTGNTNIDCSNNWWGTTDQQAINQSIYDFKNDFSLGKVNFVPFLTQPNSEATPNPNALTSESNTSPSSTPEVPEFPSITIITTLFFITALGITFYKRKNVFKK